MSRRTRSSWPAVPGMAALALHDAVCVSDDDCILFIAFEQPVDANPVEDRFATD